MTDKLTDESGQSAGFDLSTDAGPVAWYWKGPKGGFLYDNKKPSWPSTPLYATPPVPSVAVKADRPESVQAAFEVFAKKPDTGPHASAMFAYIEKLEAALSAQVQDVANTYEGRLHDAALMLLTPDDCGSRKIVYNACENRAKVYKFDAVLRHIMLTSTDAPR